MTPWSGQTGANEQVFSGPDGEVRVTSKPALVANDFEIVRQAALVGMGIGFLLAAMVERDVCAGRLVELLSSYNLPALQLNIVYPSRRHLSAKIRTFIDHLVEQFQRDQHTAELKRHS